MWVGEDFVGGEDLREERGRGFGVAEVAVGVQEEGFAAIGFFDSRRSWGVR